MCEHLQLPMQRSGFQNRRYRAQLPSSVLDTKVAARCMVTSAWTLSRGHTLHAPGKSIVCDEDGQLCAYVGGVAAFKIIDPLLQGVVRLYVGWYFARFFEPPKLQSGDHEAFLRSFIVLFVPTEFFPILGLTARLDKHSSLEPISLFDQKTLGPRACVVRPKTGSVQARGKASRRTIKSWAQQSLGLAVASLTPLRSSHAACGALQAGLPRLAHSAT
ncbi:hypothetical protein IWX90DRAFT_273182 [Phyllosticta citrichinensis]|uniref:Uncharacterized protein n=1 Tax=Phyllosticta citrichinensis TaxID=1130410 RepID=A0ABR1XMX2_9PEZI